MPKRTYKILQFHGGLNNNSDPRDIADDELSEANDIVVNEIGKIRMMGGTSTSSMPAAWANQINPGYGLFQFSHDRIDGHTVGSGTEIGADYLVFSDPHSDEGQVDIYSNEDTTWGDPITGMADNASGLRKDVFYAVDGALRVCDSDFGNSNSNKWYGYIDRTHFDGKTPGGSADAYDTWHLASAEIAAPTKGIVGNLFDVDATGDTSSNQNLTESDVFTALWADEIVGHIILNSTLHETVAVTGYTDADTVVTEEISSGDWDGDAFYIFPPVGAGFNLHVAASGSTGSIPAGTYEFATTFIYDAEPGEGHAQESLPFICAGNVAITANQYIVVNVWANAPYDARLTGGRVYTRLQNTNDAWQQTSEISLKHGVRGTSADAYVGASKWGNLDSTNNVTTLCLDASHTILSLSPLTYEINTGLFQSAPSLTAKYKTAVVANRVAYIGNVQYDGITYGDSIFQSPPNKFDTFTRGTELAASISDGDEIVKLAEYADRILQFKKRKMQLINISQYGSEFVEDTFMHKGVLHPAAVCKTDFGVAWVNREGCYLYDGKRVSNLLEKGGRQIIKESDWASFTTDSSIIGYASKKRQLIVLKDCTTSSDGDIYLFDLVTQGWVKGNSAFADSAAQTNFVTDWNNDLVLSQTSDTGTMVKWDDASAESQSMVMTTKDIDFGQPAVRKKIYKVYITYRGDATNVQVHYGVDGLAPALTFNNITSGTDGSSTGSGSNAKCIPYDAGVTDWLKAELKPSASINNINSFRLKLSGDGSNNIAADFEINDITIIYRGKNVK